MSITIRDFSKQQDVITDKEYSKIAKTFLYNLSIAFIEKALYVQLPFSLGAIFTSKIKGTSTKIDFGLFKKTGKIVNYTNLHSFGYTYKVVWEKKYANLKYGRLYTFKMIPDKTKRTIGTRGLAKHIKNLSEKGKEYISY